jgi:hypothetical protein
MGTLTSKSKDHSLDVSPPKKICKPPFRETGELVLARYEGAGKTTYIVSTRFCYIANLS